MLFPTYILSLISVLFFSSPAKTKVDLLIYNAHIYTLSPNNTIVEAMVVSKGKIIFVGSSTDAQTNYEGVTEIDLKGETVFPGFNDAHCHFYGYGEQLGRVNLVGTKSWSEVVDRAKKFDTTQHTTWIQGRGWDQNDWAIKEFPTNDLLNAAFPNQPVFLKRIDGHAGVA
ncbi:MAG: amidohydrolase family protein, partial [Bacteroidota bacterium]